MSKKKIETIHQLRTRFRPTLLRKSLSAFSPTLNPKHKGKTCFSIIIYPNLIILNLHLKKLQFHERKKWRPTWGKFLHLIWQTNAYIGLFKFFSSIFFFQGREYLRFDKNMASFNQEIHKDMHQESIFCGSLELRVGNLWSKKNKLNTAYLKINAFTRIYYFFI